VRSTGVGQSALLLLDAIAVLTSERVDYAVIGAMAASIYGVVRASIDADAILSLGAQKQSDLERTFRAAGFQTALRLGDADDPIPAVLQLTDRFENRVDLLVGLRGLEPDAFARAVEVQFQGVALRVIGREDFIAMKVFAGGPHDMSDAKSAITAAGGQLDLALLRRLTQRFGRAASDSLERLLNGP
jgi:predicted nucleotidyltransferase